MTAKKERGVARELARIASRQHGVITRAEALVAGVSAAQIDRLIAAGP